LQTVVISEFSRRFKDEYSGNIEENVEKSMNIYSQSPKRKNSNPQNSYTKSHNYSFTSDLITKLISKSIILYFKKLHRNMKIHTQEEAII
jgi:hypothetical protein